ncbi:MAG: DUF4344 domain-containing metallopeptidase [Gemmatimonadales bacterium]
MTVFRLLLGVVALAAACGGKPPVPPAAAADTAPAAPTGRFVAQYAPATLEYYDFRAGLVRNRFLDTIADRLNDSLVIPRDIVLATGHCGEPNAVYEPDRARVTLCYELFGTLAELYTDEVGGEHLITGTLVFALTHELGHALIDVLQLPVTGREEDAVDQLATILLLSQGEAGDSLAFGAIGWFSKNSRRQEADELVFADEHGLDQQRYYNILCMVYGRDRARYPEIVAERWLPAIRAERCPVEYARIAESWRRLLFPHKRRVIPPELEPEDTIRSRSR